MNKVPTISIVVPVYGCDETLLFLYERIAAAVSKIHTSFELILIDDGGPGRPWEIISKLSKKDPQVIGIKLLRNFGQHNAISAGVDIMRGSWLIIMDCDLQDRPEEIPRLWEKAQEGFDVVVGQRLNRKDNIVKRLVSKAFWRVFAYMTDQVTDPTQSSFGIYSRKVVNEIKRLPEQVRIFPLLVRWLGFKPATIVITHDERITGKSSYNLRRKLSLATEAIVTYSNKPLKLFIDIGFIIALTSLSFALFLFIQYFFFEYIIEGWTSVMVSLYFIFGILLCGIGVLGVYIGHIFNQVKERPAYVIKEFTKNYKTK